MSLQITDAMRQAVNAQFPGVYTDNDILAAICADNGSPDRIDCLAGFLQEHFREAFPVRKVHVCTCSNRQTADRL